jgi:hypothetical protein
MKMKKALATLLVVVLVAIAVIAFGVSGRESTLQPPHQIKLMYDNEDWAFQVLNSSDLVLWEIREGSGARSRPWNMTFTAGTGFNVTEATAGNMYFIDTSLDTASNANAVANAATGTTVVLPVPTANIDGMPMTFIKIDSGATDMVLYCTGGLPFLNSSGTTDGQTADAEGDSITVVPDYGAAVSYYVVGSRIS